MEVRKCFLAGLNVGVPGQVVQQGVDVWHNLAGVHGLVVPPHRLAAVVQQKLLEVPPGDSGQCLQCFKYCVSITGINVKKEAPQWLHNFKHNTIFYNHHLISS